MPLAARDLENLRAREHEERLGCFDSDHCLLGTLGGARWHFLQFFRTDVVAHDGRRFAFLRGRERRGEDRGHDGEADQRRDFICWNPPCVSRCAAC